VARALRPRVPWAIAALAALAFCAAWTLAASRLWQSEVPGDLRLEHLDAGRYFTARFLERASDFERFSAIVFVLSQAALLTALFLYARRGERFARESAAGRIGTGMLLGMIGFAIAWMVQFPFGLAEVWWGRRHDVLDIGYVDWALGSWFSLGGEFLFVSFAILIVMALAGPLRRHWWIVAAPVFVAVGLLFTFLQPYLLPDLEPLRSPALKAEARRAARDQGLEDIPVRVQPVADLTSAPNAEAVGLGPSRRVILWETLVDDFDRRQVRNVLAHEFAHHARGHLWKLFGWYTLLAVPTAFAVAFVTRRRGGLYVPEAVPLALLVVAVIQVATLPLQNVVTRRAEAEADWIALEKTRDPGAARDAEVRLAEESLGDPRPPAWSQQLLGTHPAAIDRIAMAKAWAEARGQR
jgi:STE24 endopeptidase